MKYMAILKDSLREAIDTKVFYVMVGLSLFVTLLVGSLSFRPVPAEEAIPEIVNRLYEVYPDRGRSLIPERTHGFMVYRVEGVTALTDAPEPQARDHRFKLIVTEHHPHAIHEAATMWSKPRTDMPHHRRARVEAVNGEKLNLPPKVSEALIEEFLADQFAGVGNLEVKHLKKISAVEPDPKAKPPTNGIYTYEVETRGTTSVRGWKHDPCLFFGLLPMPFLRASLGQCVFFVESTLVNDIGAWVAIILGVVITAFFIPNMLRKGTVDLLLAKPIHRSALLIYKYVGGLTFIFLNSAVAVGGIWLVLGLRTGIWSPGFLLTIFVLTFFFAILYSVSTLFGVLTRSPIVAIIVTCVVWFILWLSGMIYQSFEVMRKEVPQFEKEMPAWVFATSDAVHAVLPRSKDLDILTSKLLADALTSHEARKIERLPDVSWGESLTVSGVFITLMLGLACWRFARRDY